MERGKRARERKMRRTFWRKWRAGGEVAVSIENGVVRGGRGC